MIQFKSIKLEDYIKIGINSDVLPAPHDENEQQCWEQQGHQSQPDDVRGSEIS